MRSLIVFFPELHFTFVLFSYRNCFLSFLHCLANFLSTSQWTLMMLLFLQGPGLSVEMKPCTITLIVIFKQSRRLSVLLQVGKNLFDYHLDHLTRHLDLFFLVISQLILPVTLTRLNQILIFSSSTCSSVPSTRGVCYWTYRQCSVASCVYHSASVG